jgi:hypothetical protein
MPPTDMQITRLSDPPRAGRGSAASRTRGSTGLVHAASDYGVAPISSHPRSGRNGPGRRGSHRRACTSGSEENEQKSSSGLQKSHDGLQVRVWQLTLESTASSRLLPFAAAHRRKRRSSGDRQHPRRATVVRANGEGVIVVDDVHMNIARAGHRHRRTALPSTRRCGYCPLRNVACGRGFHSPLTPQRPQF